MKCPNCQGETRVIDCKSYKNFNTIRRECRRCEMKFSSKEITEEEFNSMRDITQKYGKILSQIEKIRNE